MEECPSRPYKEAEPAGTGSRPQISPRDQEVGEISGIKMGLLRTDTEWKMQLCPAQGSDQ